MKKGFEIDEIVLLGVSGWHGTTWKPVKFIGETPKRYKIQAITKTKLAGRNRWLSPEEVTFVPKHAVRKSS